MLSKYELLFLDQANSSSDPSQILIPQFPVNKLLNFTFANWNPLQHNPHHVLHQFPYFVLPLWITSHHKYWIYQTICKVKPTKFISRIYTDYNSIWVKHATHEKGESLRAPSLSKLDNTVNSNSIFNAKYPEFSTKW